MGVVIGAFLLGVVSAAPLGLGAPTARCSSRSRAGLPTARFGGRGDAVRDPETMMPERCIVGPVVEFAALAGFLFTTALGA